MTLLTLLTTGLAGGLMAACANPVVPAAPERLLSLPLRQAWFEGRLVDYISTDSSDAGMARAMGINHVPQLAAAAAPPGSPPGTRSAIERVYMFVGNEQLNIFPSAPMPPGPDNSNRTYSPLWLVVMVRWAAGHTPKLIQSEEALLAAADKGELLLTRTTIVVNCPVLRLADGRALTGVR